MRSPVVWTAAAAGALVVVVAGLYTQRGPIGTRLAVDYLRARGVPARIFIERLGPGGFSGSAVLGPANDPDLTVEQIDVEFEPFPMVRDVGFMPRIRAVRLVRPNLKARYADGRLTFGTLQGVVDEFLARPTAGPAPSVLIEAGTARIATRAGVVQVGGDATVARGRIVRAEARMGPHKLAADGRVLELQSASLQLFGRGERLNARLEAAAPRVSQPGLEGEDLRVNLTADLPYGESAERALDGRYAVQATVEGEGLAAGENRLSSPNLTLRFGGALEGPLDRLNVTGSGELQVEGEALDGGTDIAAPVIDLNVSDFDLARTADGARFDVSVQLTGGARSLAAGETSLRNVDLRAAPAQIEGSVTRDGILVQGDPRLSITAAEMTSGAARGEGLRVDLVAPRTSLSTGGQGWRLLAPVQSRAIMGSLAAGDLTLRAVNLSGQGQMQAGSAGLGLSWRGAATSEAGTSPEAARELARTVAAGSPNERALAAALQTLRLEAPSLFVDAVGGEVEVGLGAPARLLGDGAVVAVAPRQGQAIVALDERGVSGGLTVTTSGSALPKATLDLPEFRLGPQGLTAAVRLEADDVDAAGLQDASLRVAGQVVGRGDTTFFLTSDCAVIEAEQLVGEDGPLATDIATRACPIPQQPLVSLGEQGWTIHAALNGAGASLPAGEVRVADASGVLNVSGGEAGIRSGAVQLTQARLLDSAAERRFEPVLASGGADMKGDAWIGRFVLSDQKSRRLGDVGVTHDLKTGQGTAEIDASQLTFAQGGLQPGDVSPIAAQTITDAVGPASFTGRIGWSSAGLTSSGRVATSGLAFKSAFGPVTGLKGEVVFTSLAPLTTEAQQSLTIDHVDWLVPLTDASLTLTLTPEAMKVTKAEVGIGGGRAVLDPLDLRLGAILPTSGTLRVAGVDINNLLSEFDLGDKLSIEAKVDGVLPFAFTTEGLRFNDGRLFAVTPGRLSIKREALTGVTAAPSDPEAPPNAMQSFAYQALENLAFDKLDAQIASRPEGRLGVIFNVVGRHDPPVARTARVSIFDLIAGRAFERDIPLPKGTPVDLTLDTSLNFDELVAAYSNAGRSTLVQP